MSGQNEREMLMMAADAARLAEDSALWGIIGHLENMAMTAAIADPDPPTRERGRNLALAIRALREEIQNRIDVVMLRDRSRAIQQATE